MSMIRCLTLLVALVIHGLWVADPVWAEGSFAAFMAPGAGPLIEVYAVIPPPARCSRIASWREGASGHERHPHAQAVSLVVTASGGRCGSGLISKTFLLAHKRGYGLLEIFYVTPGGRLIFSEIIDIE
ncbi:MAG: hypothetical protein AAGD23_12905 [Pseudomonadota bacterium]